MNKTSFEWDPAKDRQNRQKHGVAFTLLNMLLQTPDA